MSEALRRTGWRNYTIFFRPDGTLFGYVECVESLEASLGGMAKEEVNQRWQDDMSPFFQLPEGAHPDQNMIEWREVFHAD
jgi:L-rhamnose mutarotase